MGMPERQSFRTEEEYLSALVSQIRCKKARSLVAEELYGRFGIQTRAGGHCAPLYHRALGTERQGAVRFSFSCYNTEEEVDLAINAVRELACD